MIPTHIQQRHHNFLHLQQIRHNLRLHRLNLHLHLRKLLPITLHLALHLHTKLLYFILKIVDLCRHLLRHIGARDGNLLLLQKVFPHLGRPQPSGGAQSQYEPDGYHEDDGCHSHEEVTPKLERGGVDIVRFVEIRIEEVHDGLPSIPESAHRLLLPIIDRDGFPIGRLLHPRGSPGRAVAPHKELFDSLTDIFDGIHFGNEVETIRPKDHGGAFVLDDSVRIRHDGDQDVTQQDNDQKRKCHVQKLGHRKRRIPHLVADLSHQHGVHLQQRLLEGAMRKGIGIGIVVGAVALVRLGIDNVEHLCEHEQNDAQRQQEGGQALYHVEDTAHEHRELHSGTF
mmetsp:Transcript_26725/g.49156  ORF Transcript_26725/g.49156 Transcript_26725/m.49156 type:complete len:340 (-) Transcript_26725:2024-3043(-)